MPAAQPALPIPLLAGAMEQDAPLSPLLRLTRGMERGEDEAWRTFHREHGPGLFRQLLAGAFGDHAVAAEALQHTYLRVARHVRPCDSVPEFAGWLRVVARSALYDCLRREQRQRALRQRHLAETAGGAAEAAAEERLHAALDAALAGLAPADRGLLEAKYFAGTSVRSLAAQLGITEKAAESRLTRARGELRARLLADLSRHE